MIGEPLSFSLFIPGIPASKGSYRPITGRSRTTVKPDIDKLQRALYDAITETQIWHDDCQITDVTSHKRYSDNTTPGVSLTISWKPNQ